MAEASSISETPEERTPPFELSDYDTIWSIGLVEGTSPLNWNAPAPQPIITAQDVTDRRAAFVADPFLFFWSRKWLLFFEVLNMDTGQGEIALAIRQEDGSWQYEEVVLSEDFHLSYPLVFQANGSHYMLPETLDADAIRLYIATQFPWSWEPVRDLIPGTYADPTIFQAEGLWWLMACPHPYEHDQLDLFWAEHLEGPWHPHPSNPVVSLNPSGARPGGKVVRHGNQLLRFAQDCTPRYGNKLRVFEIESISRTTYSERELEQSPLFGPGEQAWNAGGMHHLDAHRIGPGNWLGVVDGHYFSQSQPEDS